METIELIRDIIYIIGFSASAVALIISMINHRHNKKVDKALNDTEPLDNNNEDSEEPSKDLLDIVIGVIPKAIETAEMYFGDGKGKIKKDMVIERVQNAFYRFGIPYNEEFISDVIETYISMTNSVNTNKSKEKKESAEDGSAYTMQ